MSDTVKLIIEIDRDKYERCKERKLWSYDAEILEGAVAMGIPLDDVNKDFPQAEDIKPTVENFSNLLDNKLIRDATSEERESVNNYIKSISTKTGIKFDDVKAEIRELRDSWEKDCYHDEAEALNIALKIIDKHIGKAESEDKE